MTLDLALPSPLLAAPHLAADLGCSQLWIKRDDLIGFAGGGTKCRKLPALAESEEFSSADPVLVTGSGSSNQVRLVAALTAWSGRHCEALLSTEVPDSPAERFVTLLGGSVQRLANPSVWELNAAVRGRLRELREAGRRPYLVPGASVKDLPGYVAAIAELKHQVKGGDGNPLLVVPSGTGATAAGFLLGFEAHLPGARLLAISVHLPQEGLVGAIRRLVTAAIGEPGPAVEQVLARLEVDDSEVGPGGYANTTPDSDQAVRHSARREGLLLEPVYTGRAMAALLRRGRQGHLPSQPIVFWATGGTPNLLAHLTQRIS